jgi:deazaflavin-dependent oxidoreductase (nitroreductase family)
MHLPKEFFMSIESQAQPSSQGGGVRRRLQHFFTQGHASLYRLTGGKVGAGKSTLILTTTGRKSGIERSTPLFFFADEGRFIIIASNGGAAKHPTWWLNLQSNPHAKIQIRARVIPVSASQADVEERQRLWAIIAEKYTQFVTYQQRTPREIPVIIHTPEA